MVRAKKISGQRQHQCEHAPVTHTRTHTKRVQKRWDPGVKKRVNTRERAQRNAALMSARAKTNQNLRKRTNWGTARHGTAREPPLVYMFPTHAHPAASRKSTPHVIRSIAQYSNDLGSPATTMRSEIHPTLIRPRALLIPIVDTFFCRNKDQKM